MSPLDVPSNKETVTKAGHLGSNEMKTDRKVPCPKLQDALFFLEEWTQGSNQLRRSCSAQIGIYTYLRWQICREFVEKKDTGHCSKYHFLNELQNERITPGCAANLPFSSDLPRPGLTLPFTTYEDVSVSCKGRPLLIWKFRFASFTFAKIALIHVWLSMSQRIQITN